MGMSIEELISFCEAEEHGCRVRCKRYDDASGYTRSKNKNIRTADAITEEVYSDFYKEIIETMRKYRKIEDIYYHQTGKALEDSLSEVIEHGKID